MPPQQLARRQGEREIPAPTIITSWNTGADSSTGVTGVYRDQLVK